MEYRGHILYYCQVNIHVIFSCIKSCWGSIKKYLFLDSLFDLLWGLCRKKYLPEPPFCCFQAVIVKNSEFLGYFRGLDKKSLYPDSLCSPKVVRSTNFFCIDTFKMNIVKPSLYFDKSGRVFFLTMSNPTVVIALSMVKCTHSCLRTKFNILSATCSGVIFVVSIIG